MKKLGLRVERADNDICENIKLSKEVGFDAFFTLWNIGDDLKIYRNLAKELGMEFQSVHGPFRHTHWMWKNDEDAQFAVKELIACVEATADVDVPIMVSHAFIGFEDHNPTDAGVENFGKVLKRAEQLGVILALENTEGEEYLAKLFDQLDSPYLGFCWDSGHEMCYNRGKDLLALYGDKLVATHLNDNLGARKNDGTITFMDDLHFLPFDGVADWQNVAQRLDGVGFDGILTFELNKISKHGSHENDKYVQMPLYDYFAEAYKRARRVADLMKK